jgi:hypothetical protein
MSFKNQEAKSPWMGHQERTSWKLHQHSIGSGVINASTSANFNLVGKPIVYTGVIQAPNRDVVSKPPNIIGFNSPNSSGLKIPESQILKMPPLQHRFM